jgi:ATP/maltotriose-dependent transcriptional regulator MalT
MLKESPIAPVPPLSQGDYDVARSLCEEALAISERAEYLLGQAESLFSLGRIAMYQDEREQAHQFYSAALRLVHGMNSIVWLPSLLGNLASVCVDQGDFATARMYLQSALDIARSRNDLPNIAMTLSNLAYISLVQSDWNSARRLLSESLRLRYECYDRRLVAHSLEYCAWIAGMSQQPTRAARILGAVDAIRSEIEVPVPPVILQDYDRFVPLARSQLAPPAWDRAWAEGCAMSLEQALSYALELPEEAESDAMDSPTPHDDTIAGLSKRELEVLRLLVDGCSNKEIATRLYVSQHTVASHVAHVLNKLGVESRTAAATWAMRQGII